MSLKNLLDTKEAAIQLGVSEQRVRQLCETGQFGQKFASRWVVTEAELRAFKPRPRGRPKGWWKKRSVSLGKVGPR